MNVLRRDLVRNRRTFLIWTASIALLSVWLLSMYSSVAGPGTNIQQYAEQFPESFRKAFGLDRLSLNDILGYFGTEVHIMIILFGSIFAVLLSSSLLSREENEKTIEFLLARPVSRRQVVTEKLWAYTAYVLLFSVVVWTASYTAILMSYEGEFDAARFWALALMTTLVLLTFANLGFLGSVFITRNRTVFSGALGLVLVAYALQIAADTSDKLGFLKYVTPMKWAGAADVLTSGISGTYLVIMLAVNAAALVATYVIYSRKDILV
ncbi:MAG: ABC transporter permease subunit [Bacillota bacterium]|nr:ABC transporter permease subunit [Bacillota bacterium]